MTLYFNGSIMISVGHDNFSGLVPIETYFAFPPRVQLVPKGAVSRVMDDGTRRHDGFKNISWDWGIVNDSEVDAFVLAIAGSWDVETVAVTIQTLERGATYTPYNATMYVPTATTDYSPGGDYTPETTTKDSALRVKFVNLIPIGAYDSGFDYGFQV